MSYRPSYVKGDWKTVCDACGRLFKASQLKKRWDGVMVCEADYETRQPQDFVRGVLDTQAPPWVRPQVQEQYTQAPLCSVVTIQAVADIGVADCAMSDRPLVYTYLAGHTPTTTSVAGLAISGLALPGII